MKDISIRYCKIRIHNRLFAARVAAFIKAETGMEVGLDSGGKIGEFTVWVNGRRVEEKGRFSFPDKHKILKAVKEAPESPQPPG